MVAEGGRGTVLVTDAGRGSALGVIRSLGRAGYRVVAADTNPQSLGFRSRWTSARVLLPDPKRDVHSFADRLLDAVHAHGVDLVVPVTDLTVLPIVAHRARFENATHVALPSAAALAVALDKRATFELAAQCGVAAPATRCVSSWEAAASAANDLGFPLVLKPRASRRLCADGSIASFQVGYAANRSELERAMERLVGRTDVLLQPWCAGQGYGVELLLDAGRPLAAFQHRRLHEVPISGGASALRESVALDPALVAAALSMLQALSWTGLAMVEFKIGERALLMEINGRIWGSLPLAIAAGVDFPAGMAALHLQRASLEPDGPPYRCGVKGRDLRRDLLWIGSVLGGRRRIAFVPLPARRTAFTALAGLVNPRVHQDVFTWSDPLPGLVELPHIASTLWRKQFGGAT